MRDPASHKFNWVTYSAGVAPFVVVPGNDFHELPTTKVDGASTIDERESPLKSDENQLILFVSEVAVQRSSFGDVLRHYAEDSNDHEQQGDTCKGPDIVKPNSGVEYVFLCKNSSSGSAKAMTSSRSTDHTASFAPCDSDAGFAVVLRKAENGRLQRCRAGR